MDTQALPVEATESTAVVTESPDQSDDQKIGDVAAEGQETPKVSRRDRRAERRISKLTAKNAALEEALEKERERFAKIESRLDSLAQPKQRPQREEFESEEDYEDALVDYRLEMKQPEPPKPEEPKSQAVDQALVDRFQGFIEENESNTPGFEKLVREAHFPLSDHALAEIIDMGEDGVDVFTHLNSDHSEAMRISRLSARDQTIELEKIADSLDLKSSAPEPITPVSGNDQPVVDEAKLSTDDWIARRNKKVFGR